MAVYIWRSPTAFELHVNIDIPVSSPTVSHICHSGIRLMTDATWGLPTLNDSYAYTRGT